MYLKAKAYFVHYAIISCGVQMTNVPITDLRVFN